VYAFGMPLATGVRLGPYEILGSIGAGGMGEVYRAHDARLERQVAVKVLPEHLSRSPQALSRFVRENQGGGGALPSQPARHL
jgi:serine/threonine protein kinase